MRLIDADVTEKIMSERYRELAKEYGHYDHYTTGYGDALSVIEDSPTIEAEHVVRCKECKHLNVVNRKELYAHCPKTNTVFLPFELDTREHFCSLGERKEGAD